MFKISRSNVLIAGLHSHSALANKSFTGPKALLMNLSVAPSAVEPIKHGVLIVTIAPTRHGIKSSLYLDPIRHIGGATKKNISFTVIEEVKY